MLNLSASQNIDVLTGNLPFAGANINAYLKATAGSKAQNAVSQDWYVKNCIKGTNPTPGHPVHDGHMAFNSGCNYSVLNQNSGNGDVTTVDGVSASGRLQLAGNISGGTVYDGNIHTGLLILI